MKYIINVHFFSSRVQVFQEFQSKLTKFVTNSNFFPRVAMLKFEIHHNFKLPRISILKYKIHKLTRVPILKYEIHFFKIVILKYENHHKGKKGEKQLVSKVKHKIHDEFKLSNKKRTMS